MFVILYMRICSHISYQYIKQKLLTCSHSHTVDGENQDLLTFLSTLVVTLMLAYFYCYIFMNQLSFSFCIY